MKKSILLLISFLSLNLTISAQSSAELIKEIRAEYGIIKKNMHTYRKVIKDASDESTEGGEVTFYYNGAELKLLEVIYYGEMGKSSVEYYLKDGKVFFAFGQEFAYNRPIYWDKERAEEDGDNEFFDDTKTVVEENRFYFNHNEKLFRWLNPQKKEVDLTLPENVNIGKELVSLLTKLKG